MKKLIKQLINFGVVGVVATIIDYGLMVLLVEVFGVQYLISNAISFTVSVLVNYLLSVEFVFNDTKNLAKWKKVLIFIMLSLIGLGVNQFVMWGLVEYLYINYLIAKICATGLVMVYNFVSRKNFFENN